ncbi:MAG: alpha-1,2-fucosyltransferase [bacterium]|nr:alpha-1,2-fucosyltransferase [bacterium]
MIVMTLIGGLGNQLTGYAFAKALSIELDQDLYFDDSYLKKIEKNNNLDDLYGLRHFTAENRMINDDTYRKQLTFFWGFWGKVYRKLYKIIPLRFKKIIIEDSFQFNPKLLNLKKRDLYFMYGYWPAYKYWFKYSDTIRKELAFKEDIYDETKNDADLILKTKFSVSIHIRRGDYEKKPEVNKVLGNVCTDRYYTESINYISDKIDNPHFFLFSDDIEWVKKHFSINHEATYIDTHSLSIDNKDGHHDDGYKDMYLMSLCKNNIVANSSFSWWGAWLNNNNGKIVVCPDRWFNPVSINKEKNDDYVATIFPEDWIRISTQ